MSQDKVLGDRYRVGRVIGHGGFSVVYECTEAETGVRYAVKVLSKEKVRQAGMEEAFERECMALRRMHSCPYITNAREILQSTRNYYIVMDLADRGSLLQKIVKTNGGHGLQPAAVRKYFTQLLLGIRDMHAAHVVHRDIKPENLILDERLDLHISDFGFAAKAEITRVLKRPCGTPQYVAPEVIRGGGYIGQYADIWSCGVTLYVMLCGYLPFAAADNDRLYDQILAGRYARPCRGEGLPEVPPAAIHLLQCCLAMVPEKRWSPDRLLKHPYLQGSDDVILTSGDGIALLTTSFCEAEHTPPEVLSTATGCELHATHVLAQPSNSCPNLRDIPRLGIDVYNDPQLGRARKTGGRMGRQFESSDYLDPGSTATTEDEIRREGLSSRSSLRFLKHTHYTDDPGGLPRSGSVSCLNQSEDATPTFIASAARPGSPPGDAAKLPPLDAMHRRTPSQPFATTPCATRGATSRQRNTPTTSPSASPGSQPPNRRLGLAHVLQFLNFVMVCAVVLVVGLLKVMFDIKLNKLPMPRAVREMATSLIDGVGLGDAATPAPVAQHREAIGKVKGD